MSKNITPGLQELTPQQYELMKYARNIPFSNILEHKYNYQGVKAFHMLDGVVFHYKIETTQLFLRLIRKELHGVNLISDTKITKKLDILIKYDSQAILETFYVTRD